MPPLQLNAMCFAVVGAVGITWTPFTGRTIGPVRLAVWALGVGGLFGYHFLYLTALSANPPAEAALIAYLWPLLIVLFSSLLPGERLRARHVVGAIIAFGGAAFIQAQANTSLMQANMHLAMPQRGSARSFGQAIRCCRSATGMCRPKQLLSFAWPRQRSRC